MNGQVADIPGFEEFETQLLNTLNHLYDPGFELAGMMPRLLGIETTADIETARQVIKEHIENMRPPEDAPSAANSRKYYDLLNYRYIMLLSQEEASYKLGITSRHLRRFQHQAVHALSLHIWSKSGMIKKESIETVEPPDNQLHLEEDQLYQELQILEKNSPGVMSNLSDSLSRAGVLARSLLNPAVKLDVETVEKTFSASVHPSILNQLLLTCLQQIGRLAQTGSIQLGAHQENGSATIFFQITPPIDCDSISFYPLPEILARLGGNFSIQSEAKSTQMVLNIPSAQTINVLVVDDNPDIIHFYRRFLARTRYSITDLRDGSQVFTTIEKNHPDIMVLDVMLPDTDGWELLSQLKSLASSQDIPVIVCSVLGQKELALSFGAKVYLSKPVGRLEFIQALDYAASLL